MKRVIEILKVVVNYDMLYISGGNAEKINFKLDKNIIIVNNKDGIKGRCCIVETKNRRLKINRPQRMFRLQTHTQKLII